ncbi:dTDP-4-dehydrorhamnose 3,5-epimerase [Flavobacteriales bacterium]|nr:dTDP-4-dehydrorhamnose 3,5-epimerase [Flavobacteriales bacterium]
MNIVETGFEGLLVIESRVYHDSRGYFLEGYNKNTLAEKGLDINVAQTNISKSEANVVRGLHFQNPPFAQGKLIRVLKGAVLDVVVDIRKESSTYGKYYSLELTEENFKALWVPAGFAHGFKTLKDDTIFYYDCTEVYNKDFEGSVLWNDPSLNIDWDIADPILSPKDENGQLFENFVSQF